MDYGVGARERDTLREKETSAERHAVFSSFLSMKRIEVGAWNVGHVNLWLIEPGSLARVFSR